MLILSKINLKRYFSYSLPLTCTGLLLVPLKQMPYVIIAYIATLLNQWMLLYASLIWLTAQKDLSDAKQKKTMAFLCFAGKFLILATAICFCMHFMEKRAIIPLANYVLHIFILFIALERKK